MINREKMVAIAKDVLERIAAEKFIAERAQYISVELTDDANSLRLYISPLPGPTSISEVEKQMNYEAGQYNNIKLKELVQRAKSCNVCALGAMFMSAALQWNGETLESAASPWKQLEKFTTPKQIALIELAFEAYNRGVLAETIDGKPNSSGWRVLAGSDGLCEHVHTSGEEISSDEFCTAENMYNNLSPAGYALTSIMQNLIDNNGEFVVSKVQS